MSQWNNSYSYNNQYQEQAQGTWNGDPNGQYVNQAYYRPENNAQYVSFNEFLNQMQNGVTGATAQNYNNMQYNNFSGNNQYYQQLPSNSQTNEFTYSDPSSASIEVNPQSIAPQTQYNTEQNTYKNEIILKSNLTPTATEFVPKSSIAKPSSNQNIPETSSNKNSYENRTDRIEPSGSSSDKNWRERPQSSNKNNVKEKPTATANGYLENRNYGNPRNRDTHRNNDGRNEFPNQQEREENKDYEEGSEEIKQSQEPSSNSRNYDADRNYDSGRGYDNRRSNDSGRNADKSRNYDRSRNYDNSRSSENSRNYADNSRNSDSSRNYADNSRNSDSRNYDSGRNSDNGRNYADNSRSYDIGRNYDNTRNYDSGRNPENSRNYDSGRGYDGARNDRKNQKGKSKAKDDNRTFYNSSKEGQDVRAREYSGRRNYTGSQRLRGNDRYTQEDEQYANTYLQRDEKVDKEKAVKSQVASPVRFPKNKDQGKEVNKEMTQRERLTDQLDRGTLECLVCCDRVKQTDPVWSCGNCYHVLHLRCIRKWAVSSTVEGKWRCPACQNSNDTIPGEYRCMCGAVRSPEYQRGSSGAHTCGRSCRRPRSCPHPCTLLCHPGPCPACQATVTKQCGCGSETRSVLCSSKLPQECGRTCGKMLACGDHSCAKDCHEAPCDDCDKSITQVCHCPAQSTRVVACTGSGPAWGCGAACGRVLPCGAHVCRAVCHAPPCGACALLPATVLTCPCGKMKLDKEQRKLCTDPIPLCGNICAKPLPCGPDGDKHFCKLDCHEGPCPVCPDKTLVQCRCGHSSREVPCAELPDLAGNVLCQKKCNKKLSCGRHRCRSTCCSSTSHRCSVVCGRSLTCGLHRCEEFCHTGHCARCVRLSFEELRCACGASAIFPPVPCGARAPPCSAPCRTPRPCSHPPHHTCHQGPCPPCVVLTARRCHGLHEERKTIPCSQEDFSCGLPCGKPLPCGKHTCIKICHKGPCDTSKCTQPCTATRASCGHPCAAPCHEGAAGSGAAQCPSTTPCRRHVRATCPCGRRHAERTCADNARDRDKIISALAATKIQEGGSVDLTDVQRPVNMLKTLECDDTCRQEARSRQLALALQIRNPDVSAKLAPRYSEAVRAAAARDAVFATHVHDKLTELVQRAKNSKQKTRAHSFPSMNRQKRQFIHELCEHFGCESVAYDAEPNRNVVATADREKSWLPAMSVLEVLAREAGKRRVPGPVLRAPAPLAPAAQPSQDSCAGNSRAGGWATLTASSTWAARSQPPPARPAPAPAQPARPAPAPAQPARPAPLAAPRTEPKIDYFDNPPDH